MPEGAGGPGAPAGGSCLECRRPLGGKGAKGAGASTAGSFLQLERDESWMMLNSVAMLANAGVQDQLKHTEKVAECVRARCRDVDALCMDCLGDVADGARRAAERQKRELLEYKGTLRRLREEAPVEPMEGHICKSIDERLAASEFALAAATKEAAQLDAELSACERMLLFDSPLGLAEASLADEEFRLAAAEDGLLDESTAICHATRHATFSAEQLSLTPLFPTLYRVDRGGGSARPAVNGCRLALRPAREEGLAWPEVNRGWGEAALVLYSAVELLRLHLPSVDFGRWTIVPMGARSRILLRGAGEDREAYPLFSAEAAEGGAVPGRRLGDGVLLLLAIYVAVAREVERVRPVQPLEDALKVEDGRVGAVAMRDLAAGGAAPWDAAIRTFATNLDWLIHALP